MTSATISKMTKEGRFGVELWRIWVINFDVYLPAHYLSRKIIVPLASTIVCCNSLVKFLPARNARVPITGEVYPLVRLKQRSITTFFLLYVFFFFQILIFRHSHISRAWACKNFDTTMSFIAIIYRLSVSIDLFLAIQKKLRKIEHCRYLVLWFWCLFM